ncbi:MAG: surface glycoprotein, partial [Halobaculum sp.]
MTGTHEKVRALFLTALMVFSVFAGTVAFAGTAVAANDGQDPELLTATEATLSGGGGGDIELSFSEDVSPADGTWDHDDFTVWVDGANKTDQFSLGTTSNGGSRVVLDSSLDVKPTSTMT